ncbi:anthranilate phosphoribosyltransferase [Paenisporosarcina cavernae]|uniref:Anthranilate phosphoribosyltransferase n=1 Tax=Paenisporosarcina cavernae TaxID=2320858 RepID=A0A385YP45_9BACL|nr:anthranilate phosphoribosyltransferase [Paenisporosarcina cavernae]AYC28445.1 anthranilate phosphoribosyltransferase [Paenisporosarcina cavernae]
MREFIEKVTCGMSLTEFDMRQAAEQLVFPTTPKEDIAEFLVALTKKGETVDEITTLVRVLKENAVQIPLESKTIFDTCGTGGDGANTFNVSTTVSFVLAGTGLKVAKHGNRKISGSTGSADVLEALGIALDFHPKEINHLIKEANIAFLFAPHVHPMLKRVQEVRKSLGKASIFNLIGPLTNPINLSSQLIGVYDKRRLTQLAKVAHQLGRNRAVLVTGPDGLDEASLAGTNHLVLMENGKTMSFTLHPEEVGLPVTPLDAIRGGDANENAAILRSVLQGEPSPYYDTVLLNAGIALFAAGVSTTISEGIHQARKSIQSGNALQSLQQVITYSNHRQLLEVKG